MRSERRSSGHGHSETGSLGRTQASRAGRAGMMSLVQSRDITYKRLPMLEVVFDRLERMLTTIVRNLHFGERRHQSGEISAQTLQRLHEHVRDIGMIAIFKAVQWDNYGLIMVDSAMIYSIVDVLLGGRRGTAPMRIEGRPYTSIEASLVERLVRLILDDLSNAFAPITPISVPLRADGDQSALRRDRPAGQWLHRLPPARRPRGSRRHDRVPDPLRDPGARP